MEQWEMSREREGKLLFQFLKGIPMGMIFALPILILLFSSRFWFVRADMVANSQMSPGILMIAVLAITIFVGVLYKRHQWDMKEQQYQELKKRDVS